ncbi:hypothetical protein TIFTF001_052765 [Ficus carica]|uniref:Uncharacterized protein n=1 Tax=Ficus carica TaxID=3494 RepID=A0AA88JH27_FICCA|nr:hypothetical protein TIFTF001_052765 [Ficus carica]
MVFIISAPSFTLLCTRLIECFELSDSLSPLDGLVNRMVDLPYSSENALQNRGYSDTFKGSVDHSIRRKGGGVGARAALAAFVASFSAYFIARISLGKGKSVFIMFKANSAIKASSSESGSMNNGVPISLFNVPLMTNSQST